MPEDKDYSKNPYGKIYDLDIAYIDELTGTYNRRYLNATLSREISKIKKENKKLSLFMMDCDNLKGVNDTYGHLNGDRVLVEVSRTLKKQIDKDGTLVRYAGDEFTVIVPGKGLKESLKMADKLLQSISGHKIELKDGKTVSSVTLSIGVAAYPDDADDAEKLIDKADQALYSSKRRGKNRVSTVKDLVAEIHDRDLLLNALPCKEFIDREKELKILKKGYEDATKGAKKFILIQGKQGIGKTRLMLESYDADKSGSGFLLKCRRETLSQPYGVITDALNGFLDSLEAKEVMEILTPLKDIHKFALISTLEKIKDLPVHYSGGKAPSPKELREQDIFLAFINFIKGLKLKPITTFIDDIIWIDTGSLEVVKWMLEGQGAGAGVFIVGSLTKDLLADKTAQEATFPEFLTNETTRMALETIDLEPLTEGSVSELLKTVFSGLCLPSNVEKKIFQMSWGFPSNIEEIAKYVIDNKIVYPKKGKWVIEEDLLSKMPTSLKDILDKRIAGLDEKSKEVLSKAAILGSDFDTDILKVFQDINEGELLDILDNLKDKGIFQQSIARRETSLSFVNNVLRDSIYGGIKKNELQTLHKKVAGLLEKFQIDNVYGKLSHHLKEAGEFGKLKSYADKSDLPAYLKSAIMEDTVIEPSLEDMIEVPLNKESERIVPELVTYLRAAWINSQLYPRDNATRTESLGNLHNCIKRIFERDMTITVVVSGENIILNGRLVNKRKINLMLARGLASLFVEYGLDSITFKRGLDEKELEEFMSFFVEKGDRFEEAGRLSKLVREKNIKKIKVEECGYRMIADVAVRSKKAAEMFERMMATSPALGNLFSVDGEGLAVNSAVLSDPKKAISSISDAVSAISKEGVDDRNKSVMILEGLVKTVGEFSKKNAPGWEGQKKQLGELLLSLEPILRTEVIKDSSQHGKDARELIIDMLSGLDKEGILKVLKDTQLKSKMSPAELNEFLKTVVKSQYPKKMSHEEVLNLFTEAGIDKGMATKALEDVSTKSFFDDVAKDLIETEKAGEWEKKAIDNLRPLTEALIIKGDTKTIEKLIDSILAKMKSTEPSLRASAVEGISKVSDILLEKEAFDVFPAIGTRLSEYLRKEDNINVYVALLKNVERMITALIQKQELSLLAAPLTAIKDEVTLPGKRPVEFSTYAEGALNRITSPANMEALLLSFRKKAEKDYLPIVDLLAQLGKKVLDPLMGLLCKRDDAKLDPFDAYIKKRYIALIMKQIGEKAALRLRSTMGDKRPYVVKNVIDVLGWINDKNYISYLEEASKHPDKEVQKEALNMIKKLKGGR